jgi:hypothetical protein
MAKSQRKSKDALRALKTPVTPNRAKLEDKAIVVLDVERQAQAIVADVLVHFGAGYGAEQQNEEGAQITEVPTVLAAFHQLLLTSTIDNFLEVEWDAPPVREQVLIAAFEHGRAARKLVVEEDTDTLTLVQILVSLKEIQDKFCEGVSGAGGGPICRF